MHVSLAGNSVVKRNFKKCAKPSPRCIPASGEQDTVGRYPWKKLNGALKGTVRLPVRTFCFWTFQCELFIGVTFTVHFVSSHHRRALECSEGAHVSCPWVWSRVCCWQNSKNTSLPVRMVPWADLYSVVPGQAWRMVGDAPPLLPFQPAKSLRHSSLFFSSLRYRFGPPYFCLLYSGDTHHSDNTICLVLKWMRSRSL